MGFERASYSVNEADGTVNNLVFIIKEGGRITEQTLRFTVSSFDDTAIAGKIIFNVCIIMFKNVH